MASTKAEIWAGVGIALISAVAGIVGALIVRPAAAAPGPQRVSITSPDASGGPPALRGAQVHLSGRVENIGPGQTIWAFDGGPGGTGIFSHNGPCPVDEQGDWSCPSFVFGETKNNGAGFELYVSVVDDAEVATLIHAQIQSAQGNGNLLPGRTTPPGQSVATLTVTR